MGVRVLSRWGDHRANPEGGREIAKAAQGAKGTAWGRSMEITQRTERAIGDYWCAGGVCLWSSRTDVCESTGRLLRRDLGEAARSMQRSDVGTLSPTHFDAPRGGLPTGFALGAALTPRDLMRTQMKRGKRAASLLRLQPLLLQCRRRYRVDTGWE